jgi:hypothetical protein
MESFPSDRTFDSHLLSPGSTALLNKRDHTDLIVTSSKFSFRANVFFDEYLERNLQFSNLDIENRPNSRLHGRKPFLNPSPQMVREKFP